MLLIVRMWVVGKELVFGCEGDCVIRWLLCRMLFSLVGVNGSCICVLKLLI